MKKQLTTLGLILILLGSVGPQISQDQKVRANELPNLDDLLDWSINKAMNEFKEQIVGVSPIDGYRSIEVGEGLAFEGRPPIGLDFLDFLAPDYFIHITNSTTEFTVIPTEITVKADIYKRSLFRTKKIDSFSGEEDDLFWNYPNIGDTDGNIGVFLAEPKHYNLNNEVENSRVHALFNIPEKRPETNIVSIDNSSIVLENSTEITVEEFSNLGSAEIKNISVEKTEFLGIFTDYKIDLGGE